LLLEGSLLSSSHMGHGGVSRTFLGGEDEDGGPGQAAQGQQVVLEPQVGLLVGAAQAHQDVARQVL
jgi:hypothetical protein